MTEKMEKLDMSKMVADAQANDAKINQKLLDDTQETYEALLFHVKDFEYLISHKEPFINHKLASAELMFGMDDERLKVECDQGRYILSYGIVFEDSNEIHEKNWHKDRHGEKDVAKVCQYIATWAGRALNNKSCEDQ